MKPLYSILDELHRMPEDELQIKLRSHEDGGLTWKKDEATIILRERLDAALDALLLLELSYEIDIIDPKSTNLADAIPSREVFGCLIHSEAFNRYLNIYQYFGIRLLAGRIEPPWLPEEDCSEPTCCAKPQSALERNRPVLPLTPPPVLTPFDVEIIGTSAKRLAALADPRFDSMRTQLDAFTRSSDAARLQLWLRGLSPDMRSTTAERFEEFVLGATRRTFILANLLLRLELVWQHRDILDNKEELRLKILESLNSKAEPKLSSRISRDSS